MLERFLHEGSYSELAIACSVGYSVGVWRAVLAKINLVLRLAVRSRVPVQKAGEATGLVGTQGDLFDNANTLAVAHFRDDEVLQVD